MPDPTYPAPMFVVAAGVGQAKYDAWLQGRATAHRKRDLKREQKTGHPALTLTAYRVAIHEAVERCKGVDEYTGDPLDWSLLGTYDNDTSKALGAKYKRKHRHQPTVDHIHAEDGRPITLHDLRICSWEVNDAKGDLSLPELEALCRKFLDAAARRTGGAP